MKAIHYIIKLTALAVVVLLPGSLMAGPMVIRIDGSHEGTPTVEVLKSETYNSCVGPLVADSVTEYGALVNLLGMDNYS